MKKVILVSFDPSHGQIISGDVIRIGSKNFTVFEVIATRPDGTKVWTAEEV